MIFWRKDAEFLIKISAIIYFPPSIHRKLTDSAFDKTNIHVKIHMKFCNFADNFRDNNNEK